jgi:dephospho-CoA kinase
MDPEEARRVIMAQMPSELKRARADYVIENTGTVGDVERRAREVWEELTHRAEGGGG